MEQNTGTSTDVQKWIALLGRRDSPVDGVEDYCSFLGEPLSRRRVKLKQVRVNWSDLGWLGALREVRRESAGWRGNWVLLQFTALGWSQRGFPFGVLFVLRILRRKGARVAVMFHEPARQVAKPTFINRIRGACQDWVIKGLYNGAERAIFADPLATISWLQADRTKATFIPIGGNIPEPPAGEKSAAVPAPGATTKTVAVFCLSDLPNRRDELAYISQAVKFAASNGSKIRVVFLGRGTPEAHDEIADAFAGLPAEVVNLGLLPAGEVSSTLAASDVMLCVRGPLFPRRGSAIAGIACGVPIIAYSGNSLGPELLEAGIDFVPYRDAKALDDALALLLADDERRQSLRDRSLRAQRKYFSWDVIAGNFCDFLKPQSSQS